MDIVIGEQTYPRDEQIYPWGFLAPGKYGTMPGCCSGCQEALEAGQPLCEGHSGCSAYAFDAANAGVVVVDTQLLDGAWTALAKEPPGITTSIATTTHRIPGVGGAEELSAAMEKLREGPQKISEIGDLLARHLIQAGWARSTKGPKEAIVAIELTQEGRRVFD